MPEPATPWHAGPARRTPQDRRPPPTADAVGGRPPAAGAAPRARAPLHPSPPTMSESVLAALARADVRAVVVGGAGVGAGGARAVYRGHRHPGRRRAPPNLARLISVLAGFGDGAAAELSPSDFPLEEGAVRIIEEDVIDVFTLMTGYTYADLLPLSELHTYEGVPVRFLNAEGLLLLKAPSLRPRDQADAAAPARHPRQSFPRRPCAPTPMTTERKTIVVLVTPGQDSQSAQSLTEHLNDGWRAALHDRDGRGRRRRRAGPVRQPGRDRAREGDLRHRVQRQLDAGGYRVLGTGYSADLPVPRTRHPVPPNAQAHPTSSPSCSSAPAPS